MKITGTDAQISYAKDVLNGIDLSAVINYAIIWAGTKGTEKPDESAGLRAISKSNYLDPDVKEFIIKKGLAILERGTISAGTVLDLKSLFADFGGDAAVLSEGCVAASLIVYEDIGEFKSGLVARVTNITLRCCR